MRQVTLVCFIIVTDISYWWMTPQYKCILMRWVDVCIYHSNLFEDGPGNPHCSQGNVIIYLFKFNSKGATKIILFFLFQQVFFLKVGIIWLQWQLQFILDILRQTLSNKKLDKMFRTIEFWEVKSHLNVGKCEVTFECWEVWSHL